MSDGWQVEGAESLEPDMPDAGVFKARGSFVVRCEDCRLPSLNCLCPFRVLTHSRVRFVVLMHRLEHLKPTNTGRLIQDCLPDTQVFTWSRTEHDPALMALLKDPAMAPMIIFPDDQPDYADRVIGDNAIDTAFDDGKTPLFILLDGTWRQARRMFRRSTYLSALPVLPLNTARLTRYRLRKAASSAHLCTVEVAIELLKKSGDAVASARLDDYFDVFNDSYAASRRYELIERPTPARRRLTALQAEKATVAGE